MSPAAFIPVAEDSGLILPLGHWILETACRQLARWAQEPATAHLVLAVNVSSRQFQQAGFVEEVRAVLAQTGARPERLRLELTESVLVDNFDAYLAAPKKFVPGGKMKYDGLAGTAERANLLAYLATLR